MSKTGKDTAHDTIRGIPADVVGALRQKAQRHGKSLNAVVVEELTHALVGRPHRADLSDLVGKWTTDPQFDAIMKAQRRIDKSEWK